MMLLLLPHNVHFSHPTCLLLPIIFFVCFSPVFGAWVLIFFSVYGFSIKGLIILIVFWTMHDKCLGYLLSKSILTLMVLTLQG